ncbi:hypothetical protein BYT27DRAFT_7086520, partial [Phlegmacium glaucopus]
KLWSIYNREAESYDRALMETWKDDMDTIIIFAGLFSAVLTAFLVDASKNLKADPTGSDKCTSSDLWINMFWYMSLGFSITAALGVTLVQQWVCDYLQVFQRLSGSLERSQMWQYLFHGLSSNHMSLLVECIPAFIHISLFLFFIVSRRLNFYVTTLVPCNSNVTLLQCRWNGIPLL